MLAVSLGNLACSHNRDTANGAIHAADAVSSEREAAAYQQPTRPFEALRALVGHPVAIDIESTEPSSTPTGARREWILQESMVNAVNDARLLQQRQPKVFRAAIRDLDRILLRYNPQLVETTWHWESKSKTFIVSGSPHDFSHLENGILLTGLCEASLDEKCDDGVWENTLSNPKVRRRCLDRVLNGFPGGSHEALVLESLSGLDARRFNLLEVSVLTEYLVNAAAYFLDKYSDEENWVRRQSAASVFHRAIKAWGRWVMTNFDTFGAEEKVIIAKFFLVYPNRRDAAKQYPNFYWPGVDLFAFGTRQFDRWIAAGHPGPGKDVDSILDYIVCPTVLELDGYRTKHIRGPRCENAWYDFVLASPALTSRFIAYIAGRNDPELVRLTIMNLIDHHRDTITDLLRAIAPYPDSWRAGWRLLVDENFFLMFLWHSRIVGDLLQWWQQYPSYRGLILTVLAGIWKCGPNCPVWTDVEKNFGQPIRMEVFRDFIEERTFCVALAPAVWPSLSSGWSRAEIVIPKLDRMMSDPLVPFITNGTPFEALSALVEAMCLEQNTSDLSMMAAYLNQRSENHPDEALQLEAIIEAASDKGCRPTRQTKTKRKNDTEQEAPVLRIIQSE